MSKKTPVGEVRPSQLMFNYGVGSIVDLPKLSVIVTGLEDWPTNPTYARTIVEDRLLMAVRYKLRTVQKLVAPPVVADQSASADPFDELARIGVPVATFPRWMVCPICNTLAPLSDSLFKLKEDPYRPDRTVYRHENCSKARKPPEVVPARFLVACENGHLDDFPWVDYVHQTHDRSCNRPRLTLLEYGPSGEARDLVVRCESCEASRALADAFDPRKREQMPYCRGRRPHLRDYEEDGCGLRMRPILLGASNTWFPAVLTGLAIPAESGELAKLVEENWTKLKGVKSPGILEYLREMGELGKLADYPDDKIFGAIQSRRDSNDHDDLSAEEPDLKAPEWQVFSNYDPTLNNKDFQLRPVSVPSSFENQFKAVVLVERLREVRAMIGFTRIDAVGELTDPDQGLEVDFSPLTREEPTWVPATEIRGEGIFLQFKEAQINKWLAQPAVQRRADQFFTTHQKWRQARGLEPEANFPGLRYVLIHTFAHVLMRQLALECGYSAASIRERIYARPPEKEGGPMAGILIYTAAPDSEGTLGGLVSLGEPEVLERHIRQALETAGLCASDPLCAEHPPSQSGRTLHAVACHSCLFIPETSCERGNKYLDRALLVPTVEQDDLAFFR